MIISIEYKTHYTFSYQVPRLIQQIKLYPTDCNSQKVLEWSISTLEGELMEAFTDSLGHKIHNIYLTDSPKVQVITAKGSIKTTDTHGVIKGINEVVHPNCFLRQTNLTNPNKKIIGLIKPSNIAKPNSVEFCHIMNEAVGCSIEYLSGSTDIYTNAVDAISQGSGVCQDFAHILIGLARHYNYPARYANGFSAHESNGVSETHAWVEIYIEDLGWVAFDPSKKCCIDNKYVRIGCGFDFHDASMIKGIKCNFDGQENLDKDIKIQIQQSHQ